MGIYESAKIVDTNAGHMQPSSMESVLYVFVTPGQRLGVIVYELAGGSGMQPVI